LGSEAELLYKIIKSHKKYGGFVLPYSVCPYCLKRSYSAADLRVWKCPYCGREVVEEESFSEKGDLEDAKEEQG
jgi:ribosomal protein L37AE/L43A